MAECEGFICPLCMRNFRGVLQLEQHFQDEHAETTQSRFRSNIKNFFGKLKKKNQDSEVDEGAAAVSSREGVQEEAVVTNVSGIDPAYWEPQQFGLSRDLMVQFKRVRDVHITQTAAETNRLIIRVERLFRVLQVTSPRTSKAMKELEQSVVRWRPDKEERRCSSCGRGFKLLRRKHHCRLCGEIICKPCSQFMTLSQTYPVLSDCPEFRSLAPPPRTRVLSLKRRRGKGDRERERGAEWEEEDEERSDELRMCSKCRKLIHRKLMQFQSLEKPLITALYEKMQMIIEEADSEKPAFLHMAASLLAGDHGYRLHDAMRKRQQLIKLYEAIDGISKDILSLASGSVSDPSAVSQRTFKLCRGVRIFASTYLQDNLLTLPSLPTAQKLAEIREKKEREARERLREIEKQRELRRQEELSRGPAHANIGTSADHQLQDFDDDDVKFALANVSVHSGEAAAADRRGEKRNRFEKLKNFSTKVTSKVHFKRDVGGGEGMATLQRLNSGSGWMGDSAVVGSVDSQEDPFTLQRQQLLGFIQQARAAGRMDEVATLEESLCQIEGHMTEPQSLLSYGFN